MIVNSSEKLFFENLMKVSSKKMEHFALSYLRSVLLYRNQSIDLPGKSVDWLQYWESIGRERVNLFNLLVHV